MVGRALVVLSVSEQVTGSVSALLLLWALAWQKCAGLLAVMSFSVQWFMGACCLSQPLLPDTLHPALWPGLTLRPPEAQHRGAPGVASNSRG